VLLLCLLTFAKRLTFPVSIFNSQQVCNFVFWLLAIWPHPCSFENHRQLCCLCPINTPSLLLMMMTCRFYLPEWFWSYVLQCSSLLVSPSDDYSGHDSHATSEFKDWQAKQDQYYACPVHKEKPKWSSVTDSLEPSDVEIEQLVFVNIFLLTGHVDIIFVFLLIQKTQVLQLYQHSWS